MSDYRRTVLISTISQVLNYSIPIVTFPLMVRAFDIESYGVWVETITLISLLNIFGAYGFGSAIGALIISNVDIDDDLIYSNGLFVFLVFCGGMTAIAYFLAPLFSKITIRQSIGTEIIQTMAWLILLNGLNWLGSQVFRLRNQPLRGAIFDIGLVLVRLGAAVFAFSQRDLLLFAKFFVITQAAVTAIQLPVAYIGIHIRSWSWKTLSQIVRSGTNLALVSQASWIVMFGDRFMLALFKTSTDVALYSSSYQIAMILIALGWPHLYALLPALGQRWKAHDLSGMQQTAKRSARWMTIMLVPGVAGLTLIGEPLLKVLATHEFYTNSLLIGSISLGVALDTFGNIFQYIYYAQDRSSELRKIFLTMAIFNVCANLVAIPFWGIYGAGITTLATFSLCIVLLISKIGIELSELIDMTVLWRCIALSAIMGLWVIVAIQPDLPHLVLTISGAIVIYGLGLILTKTVKIDDLFALFKKS